MYVGVGGVEARHLAQDNEQIGLEDAGHNGGEGIVVADDDPLQLVRGHHVILVDNGHDAELQELLQGVLGVVPPLLVVDVAAGEQGLRDDDVALAEESFVDLHQLALAHGGQDLPEQRGAGRRIGQRLGSGVPGLERLLAGGHGAGGHDDHLDASLPQRDDLAHQVFHGGQVELVDGPGQQGSPQLHHHAPRLGQRPLRARAVCACHMTPLEGFALPLYISHSRHDGFRNPRAS